MPQCTVAWKDSFRTPAQVHAPLFQDEMLRCITWACCRMYLWGVGIPCGKSHCNVEECSRKRPQTHIAEACSRTPELGYKYQGLAGCCLNPEVTNVVWCYLPPGAGEQGFEPLTSKTRLFRRIWNHKKKKNPVLEEWEHVSLLDTATCWPVGF